MIGLKIRLAVSHYYRSPNSGDFPMIQKNDYKREHGERNEIQGKGSEQEARLEKENTYDQSEKGEV